MLLNLSSWLLVVACTLDGAHGTLVTNNSAVAANNAFDYVIVGAGLGGIVVGNKLSGKGFSVLIIEAGPDDRGNPAVVNAEDRVYKSPVCNWQYPYYNDDGSLASGTLDSGACIGGSTSTNQHKFNGMVWYRPTKAEIDKIETLGNPGWNWKNLEPYMTAIERNILPDMKQVAEGAGVDPAVHGYHGAINTSFPTPMRIPRAVSLFKQALPLVFSGLNVGDDLSNRTSVVSASTSWTIWYDPVTGKNRRSSAADGLLWAANQQRNLLTVLANHKVDKVVFDEHMVARGLVFVPNNRSSPSRPLSTVYAKKGVILSAGSLGSAPILERSGIGQKSVLHAARVRQLVDLPGVGLHLNTSALVVLDYQNDSSIIDGRSLFAPEISLVNIDELWGGSASTIVSGIVSPAELRARAQALVSTGAAANTIGAEAIMPVAEFIAESAASVLEAVFWPLMPLSRGHIHINTSDPLEDPIITPRFLTDAFDQAIAVAISRRSRAVFSTSPLADLIANAYYDPPIGPDGTDAEYLAWFQNTSSGADHWIGSTAMMPRHLGGVVDSSLRVYGTSNLHVVDAGILPLQLTSHLMSAVYAITSRAADLILAEA
ncbi:GMC oxidoreductase [Thozetella sp. PMI_491]|nr:GMC oxidoreductase [Thozetella sp. PMI_491]